MSKSAEQVWALIEQLPPDERQELSDRLIRESRAGLDDIEVIAIESAERVAAMLDAEEDEAAAAR